MGLREVKLLTSVFIRAVLAVWVPAVGLFACSIVWADEVGAVPEGPGIHLSVGVLSVLAGLIAFVGPGFYLLGRYDHRLSTTEGALLHVERQMETMVERSIVTGDRMAVAIEKLAEGKITIECPGGPPPPKGIR